MTDIEEPFRPFRSDKPALDDKDKQFVAKTPEAPPAAPKLKRPASLGGDSDIAQTVVAQPTSHISNVSQASTLTEEEKNRIGIVDLLRALIQNGASDLHVPANAPIKIRVNGNLRSLIVKGGPLILSPEESRRLLLEIATQEQIAHFEEFHELDFAYDYPSLGSRFRVNYFFSRGSIHGVFRTIPHEIKSLEQLGMPPILKQLANAPRGMVLVTGPTGSGKSTTLAAMIDYINQNKESHILTIEDPIEFVHDSKKSLISQRELHSDTYSWASSLKAALREDPDVILVGEMRDPETIELGLTAAETGHLVFGTLHTQDASQTIDRLVDSFPASQQNQVRAQLSLALRGVVSQQLIRTSDNKGRVAALEILVSTSGIRNMLREGQTEQIYSALQTGAKDGMQTMEMALADLVSQEKISKQLAAAISSQPGELDKVIAGKLKAGMHLGGKNI